MWDVIVKNGFWLGLLGLALGLGVAAVAWRISAVNRQRKRRKEDDLRRRGI